MKLTPKGKKRQAAIANALKKGLPLAGLLSSLVATTGCDVFFRRTAGDVPNPDAVSDISYSDEKASTPSQNHVENNSAEQANDKQAPEPRPLMGKPAPPCEEKDAESEKQPRPLMGAPLPPPAEPPADKANQ